MHTAGVLISGPVDCLYVYIQPGVFGEHGQVSCSVPIYMHYS